MTVTEVPPGLAGVVVTETQLSDVRGLEGFYHYRQYSAIDLAKTRSFEDVWFLMLYGRLPEGAERDDFVRRVATARHLPATVKAALPQIVRSQRGDNTRGTFDGLAALRPALALIGAAGGFRPVYDLDAAARQADAIVAAASVSTLVAALYRLNRGDEPIEPRDDLPHAANYLYMLTGEEPESQHARAVEQYLVSTIEHGFNASTFTARVIASTGADMSACLVGALGALSGPLHGGAPARALEALDAISAPDRIDEWVRGHVLAGERIMGFGHPVYRTEDPRSRMLRETAQSFGGELVDFAVTVEERVLEILAELKPHRPLHTNVEFYAAVVMELCGLPRELFTPTFAVARVVGWTANVVEQANDAKIIRPAARYVGETPPQPIPSP